MRVDPQDYPRDNPPGGYLLEGRLFLLGMVCRSRVTSLDLVLSAIRDFCGEMKRVEKEELKQNKNLNISFKNSSEKIVKIWGQTKLSGI